jgi:penicillin-binding protein 2
MSNNSGQRLVIQLIFIAVGLIFLIRLLVLQVLDASYTNFARNNVLHPEVIYPARGLIYDRYGKLLVYNDAIYNLMIIPEEVKEFDTADFCRLLNISRQDFLNKFNKAKNYSPVKATLFEKQLSNETYAAFQEKLFNFPGFFVERRTDRRYKHRNAAHMMGYIEEVTPKEIEKYDKYYSQGDYIGRSGLERSYETALRGERGIKFVMVDVLNREQGSFKNGEFDSASVPGQSLETFISQDIQAYGEQLMLNKIGSIVAIEPATGGIIAMVSSPTYDPNLFIGRERGANYHKLSQDPSKPLFNRPLNAAYPPGSIFKMIMALVGQQEKVLWPEFTYSCYGGYNLGGLHIGCHPHNPTLDLRGAVQISCNAYFCQVFRNVIDNKKYANTQEAFENWRRHLLSFGLGKKLDIDLAHELPGLLPSVALYDKMYGAHRWKSSTVLSLAIGQGEMGITPLQMANVTAIIANRGFYYTPHVVRSIGGKPNDPAKYGVKHYTTVDSTYYRLVVDAMEGVINAGTGVVAKLKDIAVCGKTGTAQNPHGKDHSIFIAFAPKDNPKIAIAVVIENSGFGATWAAPIASLMMEKYLTDTITRPWLEERMLKGDLIHTNKNEAKPAVNPGH